MTRARSLALAAGLALAACASAPPKKSDPYLAKKGLAQELLRRGDHAGAFPVVNALHQEDPQDPDVLVMRGDIYREQRLLPEARADLQDALAIRPDDAHACSSLALVLELEGSPGPALELHRKASALDPKSAAYLNNLGFSLLAQRRTREAIPVFVEALKLDPTSPRTRNNLGFAYARAGDFSRAAEQFGRGGTPAQARNNLGWAYQAAGQTAQAYDLYLEALRLDPGLAQARQNLTEVARRLGRPVPSDLPAAPRS
jgi:Tfp pilus assembly protein PilF